MEKFRDPKTGRFKACRLSDKRLEALYEDPMSAHAPLGDIIEGWRRRDLREGCPRCTQHAVDNAGEWR